LSLNLDFRADLVVLPTVLLFAVFWAWSSYNNAPPACRVGDAVLGGLFGMLWGLVAGTVLLFVWRDPLVRVVLPFAIVVAALLGFAGDLCGRLLAPVVQFADLRGQLVCLGIGDALFASILIFRWASGRIARHRWLHPVVVFALFFSHGFGCGCWHGRLAWGLAWAVANGVLGLIVMRPLVVFHSTSSVPSTKPLGASQRHSIQ